MCVVVIFQHWWHMNKAFIRQISPERQATTFHINWSLWFYHWKFVTLQQISRACKYTFKEIKLISSAILHTASMFHYLPLPFSLWFRINSNQNELSMEILNCCADTQSASNSISVFENRNWFGTRQNVRKSVHSLIDSLKRLQIRWKLFVWHTNLTKGIFSNQRFGVTVIRKSKIMPNLSFKNLKSDIFFNSMNKSHLRVFGVAWCFISALKMV